MSTEDVSRRDFFGTLAALMIVPKLVLGSESKAVYEPDLIPPRFDSGSSIQLCAVVSAKPLRITQKFGPFTQIVKGKTDFRMEWKSPGGVKPAFAQLQLQNISPSLGYVKEMGENHISFGFQNFNGEHLLDEDFFISILLAQPKA